MQFQRQRCRPGLSFATDRARQWPVLARWSALVTRRDLATRTDSSVRCGTIQKQTTYRAMYSISIYLTCHVGEVYTWNMKKCIEHRYYQAKYLELKQTISFSRGWLVVKQEDVQSQEVSPGFPFLVVNKTGTRKSRKCYGKVCLLGLHFPSIWIVSVHCDQWSKLWLFVSKL